ncbi:MAG TPA: Uma2 family endonuclease [Solirubrobacteraceae bacterium]|jgi:Uma2 family endonuclease|nr:Uma2 family endonuclease [Solirubrobacteraceae bacterium]
MRTLVLDPPPQQMEELLERRRHMGADRRDEVWEGVYHMVPGPSADHSLVAQQLAVLLDAPARTAGFLVTAEFNLGAHGDFRVPDLGIHRERPRGTWIAIAAVVVEIVSPGDETWEKLPFYAEHGVDELLLVDPDSRSVELLSLKAGTYRRQEQSELIELSASELARRIDWPAQD